MRSAFSLHGRCAATALLALACLFSFHSAHAQDDNSTKDPLFAGVEVFSKGASDSTDVTLDKNMLAIAGSMKGKMSGLAGKMDFVSVHEYEYPHAGLYNMADVERFQRELQSSGWEHLVRERSKNESTDVCVKLDNEGQMRELVVISAEPQELSFVHLKGHLSLSDLKNLQGLGAVADPKLMQRPQ